MCDFYKIMSITPHFSTSICRLDAMRRCRGLDKKAQQNTKSASCERSEAIHTTPPRKSRTCGFLRRFTPRNEVVDMIPTSIFSSLCSLKYCRHTKKRRTFRPSLPTVEIFYLIISLRQKDLLEESQGLKLCFLLVPANDIFRLQISAHLHETINLS